MPNWVTSNIKIKRKKEGVKKLVKDLKSEHTEFDFNAIIPMPSSLNVESNSIDTISMCCAYLTKPQKEKERLAKILKETNTYSFIEKSYWDKMTAKGIPTSEEVDGALNSLERNKKENPMYKELGIETLEDLGNVYLNNIEKYKHDTWYNWSYDNWGTKWNASNTSCNYDDKNDRVEYWIDTAWSAPIPIIIEIVKKYKVDVEIWFCDEDMYGGNLGHYTFEIQDDGSIVEINHEDSDDVIIKHIFGVFEN